MVAHPDHRRLRAAAALVVAATAGCALVSARGAVGDAGHLTEPANAVVGGAQWALWLLALYVAAVVGVAAASVLADRPTLARLAVRGTPFLGRSVLAAALGVGVTASPAAAAPLTPASMATASIAAAEAPPSYPPSAVGGPTGGVDPFAWSAPPDVAPLDLDLARAASRARAAHAARVARGARVREGGGRPTPPARTARRRDRTVRVRAGDCLWSLAARDLTARGIAATPATVAATWPRWFAANRRTIGPDPGLLRPGEVLRAPVPAGPHEAMRRPR